MIHLKLWKEYDIPRKQFASLLSHNCLETMHISSQRCWSLPLSFFCSAVEKD